MPRVRFGSSAGESEPFSHAGNQAAVELSLRVRAKSASTQNTGRSARSSLPRGYSTGESRRRSSNGTRRDSSSSSPALVLERYPIMAPSSIEANRRDLLRLEEYDERGVNHRVQVQGSFPHSRVLSETAVAVDGLSAALSTHSISSHSTPTLTLPIMPALRVRSRRSSLSWNRERNSSHISAASGISTPSLPSRPSSAIGNVFLHASPLDELETRMQQFSAVTISSRQSSVSSDLHPRRAVSQEVNLLSGNLFYGGQEPERGNTRRVIRPPYSRTTEAVEDTVSQAGTTTISTLVPETGPASWRCTQESAFAAITEGAMVRQHTSPQRAHCSPAQAPRPTIPISPRSHAGTRIHSPTQRRSLTPTQPSHSTAAAVETPHHNTSTHASHNEPWTVITRATPRPTPRIPVYDDAVPAALQPDTPADFRISERAAFPTDVSGTACRGPRGIPPPAFATGRPVRYTYPAAEDSRAQRRPAWRRRPSDGGEGGRRFEADAAEEGEGYTQRR